MSNLYTYVGKFKIQHKTVVDVSKKVGTLERTTKKVRIGNQREHIESSFMRQADKENKRSQRIAKLKMLRAAKNNK